MELTSLIMTLWDGARGKAGRGLHVARLIAERPRVSPLSPEGRAIGQDEFMHVARVPVEMSGLVRGRFRLRVRARVRGWGLASRGPTWPT